MAQYLDEQGLRTLVGKTKEFANKRVKDGLNTSAAATSKTITGWEDATSAAIYSPIAIEQSQVTGLEDALNLKAPLASPTFTGTPTAPTAVAGTNTTQIATTEFVTNAIGNIGEAMHYKGSVDGSHPLPSSGAAGDTWKVAASGTYAGHVCEVGDMIIANTAFSSAPTSAQVDVIQTNIDGAVSGPASATDGAFALFDGTTGKLIKSSDVTPSSFKTKQSEVSLTGSTTKTITALSQNNNGVVSATFTDIQSASTAQAGITTLSSTSGSAENVAATPKLATDLYNALNTAKQDNLTFDGTYNPSNNKAATVSTVSGAIQTLDADVTSTNGKNVQVQVTEADGKITAVNITTDNTVTKVTGTENDLVLFGANGAIKDVGLTSAAFATSAQGAKADTAIQGVKANGTALTPGENKIVNIPLAASGTIDGLMSKEDKAKLDGLNADLEKKADKVTNAVNGHIATLDASGNLVDGGHALSEYKTKQTAVNDPDASGTGITFIDSISQDDNGVITPHKKTVQSATAEQAGLMSSADFGKLAGIYAGATKVNMGEGAYSGTLYINNVSAMSPINDALINALFT